MVRIPSCEKNGLKKGAWAPEEDNKLTAYIKRYGIWNWRELPRFADPMVSEAKLHADEISECDADRKIESEPSTPTHQIVETSPLSKFSSLKTDSAAVIGSNYIIKEKITSSETFVESEGNFWTEPYSAGNYYIQEDFPTTWADTGLEFPLSQVSLGDVSCPYGKSDVASSSSRFAVGEE
ncbi:hypothetical protein HHK36_005456 [Tetracentron sinense]|uniref:Myb-like domain-containing protein n=1 Tax=Tetracentron sinense TaxID=13715 RepID=A0A834Y8I1_TETSI|nr:hypothetical protein HHK36_032082 [Tetracentron sinense]KAF8409381.1 hypothetical protein HHK36_005456 [Tetracentron sinense]